MTDAGIAWGVLAGGLLGGLALLLYGLERLTTALRTVAGDSLRVLLARLTNNRVSAVTTGAFATAVVQSSTATTVLVVGFVGAGLMTLGSSLGVILGSNVGTTITAQVVAFDVAGWALAIIAAGFAVTLVARSARIEGWGTALLGLGLVFLGMQTMGSAVAPLRDHPQFVEAIARVEGPLLGVLAGAAFTAIVQSSSATTVLAIVLAAQGLLPLEVGVSVVIGANIGTCVTAGLAAIGKSRDAQRAAAAHVLFNLGGAFIWLLLLDRLVELSVAMSPGRPDLEGTERLASEVPRQLANAHTLFNVGTVLVFVWFLGPIERWLSRLLPDRVDQEPPVSQPRFLERELLATPALALAAAGREVSRLGDLAVTMIRTSAEVVLTGDRVRLNRLREADADVDGLYDHIIAYLASLGQSTLLEDDGRRQFTLLEAANAIESIADIVETTLVSLGFRRLDSGVRPSASTSELVAGLFETAADTLTDAVAAVVDEDEEAADRVMTGRHDINRRLAAARVRQAGRLTGLERNRRLIYAIEMDIYDAIKRIEYLARHMVRVDR